METFESQEFKRQKAVGAPNAELGLQYAKIEVNLANRLSHSRIFNKMAWMTMK